MGFLRAQVSIPSDTLMPADASMNVWHFETPGAAAAGVTDANARLTTFYGLVDALLAPEVASPATVKYYDLEDASPRVPVATTTIGLTPGGTTGYPGELAICLSYQADAISGQSQARRRGRFYLGPLLQSTGTPSGAGRILVSGATITTIATAATGAADNTILLGALWSVFSPTTAGPEPWSPGALSSAFALVTNGWIDNAFDIQRRRGTAPTTRTTWT